MCRGLLDVLSVLRVRFERDFAPIAGMEPVESIWNPSYRWRIDSTGLMPEVGLPAGCGSCAGVHLCPQPAGHQADVSIGYRGTGAGAKKKLKIKKEVSCVMVYRITKEVSDYAV